MKEKVLFTLATLDEHMKKLTDFTGLNEVANLIGVISKWGTLFVGGFCLLMYSNDIGQFPEGLNIGEGLAFYLLSASFLVVYVFYFLAVTAMGALLIGLGARLVQKLNLSRYFQRASRREDLDLRTDFSQMTDIPVIALGLFGLMATLVYASIDWSGAGLVVMLAFCQGILIMILMVMKRRQAHFATRLITNHLQSTDENARGEIEKEKILNSIPIIILVILLLPLWVGPNKTDLVNAAFRVAQLRKDNAIIHVKKPWSVRVSKSTLVPAPSFLGDDFVEFHKVNVLLRSVGQKVVIELPQKENKPSIKLPIPSDAIYVE